MRFHRKKSMGLLPRKVAQKRQKTQFFENFSFFLKIFEIFSVFFLWKIFEKFFIFFEKFSKIFQIIFLIFFRNFSTWNLYISKIFKSLSSESFSNVLVRKPFGRDVRVWRTSVSKSFGLETYLPEISIFKNFPKLFFVIFQFLNLKTFSNLVIWEIFQT